MSEGISWFLEVSDGLIRKTPPEIINFSDLNEWQKQHQSSENGLFSSIYLYPTDDPYIGGVLSDFYMDFDYEESPDKARREAVAVVKKLVNDYEIPEENIWIAFSGMKGISITVDYGVFNAESSTDLPLIWKSMVQDLIVKLKLKTADTSIYERRRLWRLLNSRHQKSSLHKIPLTLAELEKLTIDEIKQMADKPRQLSIKAEAQPILKAIRLFEEHKSKVERWLEDRKKAFQKTELKTLEDDPPCVRRRLEIGAKAGSRNSFLFQLAIYYADKGLTEPEIIKICYEFANRCEQEPEPFPKTGEVESIVSSALKGVQDGRYSVGCSSEALVELCDKQNCPFFKKPKDEEKKGSCGEDLPNIVFEQTENDGFLVYHKETGEITKQKLVNEFKPLTKLLWKPVDGVEDYESDEKLWWEVRQHLHEHIDLSEGYDVLTAWVLASWIPEKWRAVPYLFFYGPAGSGKTWALEVLASLGFRSFLTSSTRAAGLFRVCNLWHLTLFLDEAEMYIQKERDEIIHLLNAGYRRGSPAVRVEDTKEGMVPMVFDVFGFKALAGTKEFVKTLKSRCITFNMSKATRKIKTKIDDGKAAELRRKLLCYRFRKLSEKQSEEEPDIFDGRQRELFNPLIMVAPMSAKNVIIEQAKKIEESEKEEEQTSNEALVFKAILEVYRGTQEKKLTIKEIVDAVNKTLSLEESLSSVSVGMVASRLGFKKTMKKGERAIFWNQELAQRLAKRYVTAEDTAGFTAWLMEKVEST